MLTFRLRSYVQEPIPEVMVVEEQIGDEVMEVDGRDTVSDQPDVRFPLRLYMCRV